MAERLLDVDQADVFTTQRRTECVALVVDAAPPRNFGKLLSDGVVAPEGGFGERLALVVEEDQRADKSLSYNCQYLP